MNRSDVLVVKDLTVSLMRKGKIKSDIVRNLNFHVKAGETLCIVGESGSGKSVSSMAIMGLLHKETLKATRGTILLNGQDIIQASEHTLRGLRATQMAMVFQEPMTALNPVLKVGKQVEEVLALHTDIPKKERKSIILQMFNNVHLPDIERIYNAYPHELSGGQRQRIVIAIALILKPKLLIADEPTTALDVTTQKQILNLIKELQEKQGTAVLFITHDFGVVAEIADRILVMRNGEAVETGNKEKILTNPSQEYTQLLVTSVPSLHAHPKTRLEEEPFILEVKDLKKIYQSKKKFFQSQQIFLAAENISFQLKRREIIGIVGESGSGKSTVARCVMRLIDPSEGEILLDGFDIARVNKRVLTEQRRKIQIIFQDPYRSLNPRRKIGDSVIEGLINQGMSIKEAREKAENALLLVGLPADAYDRFPHQFSGGQRQRICIARALVMEPEILVADEAVSALDVSVQAQVLDLLEDIRQRMGIGVLFITHDLRVAAKICDSIMVMKKGKIVEYGTAFDVLNTPKDSYTKSLINAAPGRFWDFQHLKFLGDSVTTI